MKKYHINYNTNPVNILVGNLPSIQRIDEDIKLSDELEDISAKVALEFQKDLTGELARPNGKIPGWDGNYLSAGKKFMDYVRKKILSLDNVLIPALDIPKIDARVVKVSKNLASEYFNMTREGNHSNNLIAPMGLYIVPIIEDKTIPIMMFDKRSDDAFLDPGRLNSMSKALAVANSNNYLEPTLLELEKKYGITVYSNQVKPIGMLIDNVHNIALPLGYARIPMSQAEKYNRQMIPNENIVPVKDLKDFIKKNPIESWTITGFAAAFAAMIYGLNNYDKTYKFNTQDRNLVYNAFQDEFNKLKEHPLNEKSSLDLLNLKY